MTSPTHDELRELTGAYVLGMLSDAERNRFEVHLATCAECAREVQDLTVVAAAVPHAVPQQDPPRELRARVLKHAVAASQLEPIGPVRYDRRGLPAWLAVAASIAAVALGLYSLSLRERVGDLENRLREANARVAEAQGDLQIARAAADRANQLAAVLEAPDVRRIELAGQKGAPSAAGRAFWSPSRGLVFTATNLPPVSPGRQYQLWVIPPGGKPISAGLLDLQSGGIATVLVDARTAASVQTVAVTVEPAGGVPQPTGEMVLAGTL
jgi:anti-sigma-K factor RskA